MTQKNTVINYVIGSNQKKEKIFEKKQESPEYARKLGHVDSHCDVREHASYKSIYKSERKKVFFENSLTSLGLQTI